MLHLPPTLHAELLDAARRAGLSLNEYCVHALSAPGTDPAGPGATIAARAIALYGPDLVGVLLNGSWARGEATAASDTDALIVLEASRPITRALYREWDGRIARHLGRVRRDIAAGTRLRRRAHGQPYWAAAS